MAHLDAKEAVAADIEQKLFDGLNERLAALTVQADALKGTLEGHMGSRLTDEGMRAQKIVTKLTRNIDKKLGNAYTYGFGFGAQYPTNEQVVYGLETGNHLEAMGMVDKAPPPSGGEPPPQPPTQPPRDLPPGPPPPIPPIVPLCPPGSPSGPPPTPPRPGPDWCPIYHCWDQIYCHSSPTSGAGECLFGSYKYISGWDPPERCVGGTAPPPPSNRCALTKIYPWTDYATWESYIGDEGAYFPPGLASFTEIPGSTDVCWERVPMDAAGNVLPGPGPQFALPLGWSPHVLSDLTVVGWTGGMSPAEMQCFRRCTTRPTPPPGEEPPDDAVCEVPFPPECGPTLKPEFPKLEIGDDDACAAFPKMLADLGAAEFDLAKWIGMRFTVGNLTGIAGQVASAITGSKESVLPGLANRLVTWVAGIMKETAAKTGCNLPEATTVSLFRSVLSLIHQYIPVVPPELTLLLNQVVNFACQSKMPTGADADRAYLANAIDIDVWECWHKIVGDKLDPAKAVRDSARTRPDWRTAIELLRKGLIDEKRYDELTRQNGVVGKEDKSDLWQSTKAWPPFSDVIRFMMRDTADEQFVDWTEVDKVFQTKYTGKVKEWGEGNGMDEEIALHYWRAHFDVPSYTQGAEMVHRLRPGAVDKDLVFTREDFRKMLLINDMSPQFIDRLIEITYHPINLSDGIKMYELHTIDDDRFAAQLEDNGYTKDNAKTMVDYYKAKRKVSEAEHMGLPSKRQAIRKYSAGTMTRDELESIANRIFATQELADQFMSSAAFAKDLYQREQRVNAIRRQYLIGLLSDADAQGELANVGVEPSEQAELITVWSAIRAKRGKMPSAAILCKWRSLNIITRAQQLVGLIRMGWEREDALRIVRQCETELAIKEDKAQRKAAKEAAAAEAKAKKDAAKCPPKPCPKPKNGTPARPTGR